MEPPTNKTKRCVPALTPVGLWEVRTFSVKWLSLVGWI